MIESDPVKKQYSEWVYPNPAATLDESWQNADPNFRHLHFAYWPNRQDWQNIRILVAGCGSNQAAQIAYRNPSIPVVGIDISEKSLAHSQLLKDRFGLHNLTLENIPIDQIAKLNTQFDLVVTTGVLHHLADPVAALANLRSVLTLEGVIYVMVYGRYFRTGVYMLQDVFRKVGLGQGEEDVALVRQTLARLHPSHLARNYIQAAADLTYDAGVVDTFLHKVDRAYAVPECLDLVQKAGLTFQGWGENFLYYPDGQLPAQDLLSKKLATLSGPDLWAAMELLHGALGTHEFFCCRTDRPERSYRLDFETNKFFELVPIVRNAQLVPTVQPGVAAFLTTPFGIRNLSEEQLKLFQKIDGERSVERCIAEAGLTSLTHDERRALAKEFFVGMWRMGHVLLRHQRLRNLK